MIEANEAVFRGLTCGKVLRWFIARSMKRDLQRIGVSSSGCVITRNGQKDEIWEEDRIINELSDKTGYEIFKNEWNYRKGLPYHWKEFRNRVLMTRMSVLRDYLREHYPDKEFTVIGLICLNETQVRFHEIRKDESWLARNIDGYEEGTFVLY